MKRKEKERKEKKREKKGERKGGRNEERKLFPNHPLSMEYCKIAVIEPKH